ncbi:hypothetical protein SynBIOSE41_01751 [Synechococcus sp. BIOS-E4-1]|nr:hypothetical protein SynBIOSE41_01751 [Synechococcus sp. BIOS-E4-1]
MPKKVITFSLFHDNLTIKAEECAKTSIEKICLQWRDICSSKLDIN